MFIKLELWDEEPRADTGKPVQIGSSIDAHLDMRQLRVRHRTINLSGILSFEPTRIWTNGRPGTSENKTDVLDGIRVLLLDGSQYIIINDKETTFLDAIALAQKSSEVVYDFGPSGYMQRFATRSPSA